MTITAMTERCPWCHGLLASPPAPRVCEDCGRVRVTPRHETWPKELKAYAIACAIERIFRTHRPQSGWEFLLLGIANDPERLSRRGQPMLRNPDDVYVALCTEAATWAAGAPPGFTNAVQHLIETRAQARREAA